MFKKIKKIAHRLTTDAKFASKAVFLGITLFAFSAFAIEASSGINSQLVSGDVLLPPAKSADLPIGSQKNLPDLRNAVNSCRALTGKSKTLLKNFEKSFDGVLPGAGILLTENPASVANRREKLIFEVMRKYAELEFCITSTEEFQKIYFSNYSDALSALNVHLHSQGSLETGVFVESLEADVETAISNFRATQTFVESVVDRSIDSAVKIDEWTEERVTALTGQTTNQLLFDLIDNRNNANQISASQAAIESEIRELLANFVNGTPNSMPPTQTTPQQAETIRPDLDYGDHPAGQAKLAFGLLNLVNGGTREIFLGDRFKYSLAFYLAASGFTDPLQPSAANFVSTAQNAPNFFAANSCPAIEVGNSCFDSSASTNTSFTPAAPRTRNATQTIRRNTTSGGYSNPSSLQQEAIRRGGAENPMEVKATVTPVWVRTNGNVLDTSR